MRARMTLVLLAIAAVSSLDAQRANQFEIGPFASFTRYDRVFNLGNQIGFGGRVGYFFSRTIGIEVDAGHQSPSAKTGPATATLTHGSASLVLNFGTEKNIFYILGGYSRLDFEDTAPYRFTDNAVHGAIGDRIFLGGTGTNDGGIDVISYDGTTATQSSAVTVAALKDFLETTTPAHVSISDLRHTVSTA